MLAEDERGATERRSRVASPLLVSPGMKQAIVTCEQCGSNAEVIATEGELFLAAGKAKPRVTVVIECPKCGRREQAEVQRSSK
jgi:hypothetical protein